MANPTDTPRLPRVATRDDIRPGAVVRTAQGYEYTVTARGKAMALYWHGGQEYCLHREKVDAGRVTLLAEAPPLPADWASFAAWLDRKAAWSRETFGPVNMPDDRTRLWQHMRSELHEMCADWDDMTEPADLILLAFDYMARHGMSGMDVVAMLVGKDRINQHERTWPDWRTADPTMPMEHVEGDGHGE
jgi:hypothetical protein